MKIINSGYDYHHQQTFGITRPNGSGDNVLLILRSPAYFVLSEKRITSTGNAAVLYRKGTPQIYGAHHGEFVNDWVHFELSAEEEAWVEHTLRLPFDTLLSLPDTAPLSHLAQSICKEQYSSGQHAEESAALYFRLLLLKLSELREEGERTGRSALYERFARVRESLYLSPRQSRSVSQLAESLSVSLSYFQHTYKRLFGTSAKKDLTAGRMEYAKHLLSCTDDCVYSIADLCGYENDVHFMRVFKEYTGLTPTEYRRENRSKPTETETDHEK